MTLPAGLLERLSAEAGAMDAFASPARGGVAEAALLLAPFPRALGGQAPSSGAGPGRAMVARETALPWVRGVARGADADWIRLARNAVDAACAETIAAVRRGAGLTAVARPHRIERLCRNLATLRHQPALDEVLLQAVAAELARVGA